MSGAISVVKGYTLRATKTDKCGRPLEGNANRLVTNGFIKAMFEPDIVAAEELEQKNAEGKVCVSARTPPELKRHKVTIDLCGVDPDLYAMFANYERILDYDGSVIGIGDQTEISDRDTGVAIEIWTGGADDEDCGEVPTDDSIFSQAAAGVKYGYILCGSGEWVPSSFSVEAAVANFSLSGITRKMPNYGRGPYNVARINSDGDAGRLLVPVGVKRHLTFFKTPIAPPEPTNGAAPLSVESIFTDPNFYFGGPANEAAADVAPDQIDQLTTVVTLTGAPGGGNITLLFNGLPTGTIAYDAANSAVKSALAGVDDGYTAAEFTVTGNAGGPWTIKHPFGTTIAAGTNSLTGGTDPAIEIS
jgi:hypothetical protein